MGNNNEVPFVHSDNVDDNIFTINIPSTSQYHLLITNGSVMVVT